MQEYAWRSAQLGPKVAKHTKIHSGGVSILQMLLQESNQILDKLSKIYQHGAQGRPGRGLGSGLVPRAPRDKRRRPNFT